MSGVLAALVAVASCVLLVGAPVDADPGGRWATVEPAGVNTGDWVTVQGGGFGSSALALVETCATQSRAIVPEQEPQPDCEAGTAVNVPIAASGAVTARLHVLPPVGGCPCFVRVRSTSRPEEASVALEVDGVPGAVPAGAEAPNRPAAEPAAPADATPATQTSDAPAQSPAGAQGQVRVLGAVLAGGDSWGTWFGRGAERTLLVTVENSGTAPVDDPVLHLTAGRSANPSDPVEAPAIGPLAAGERRRIAVPVRFDGLPFGSYSVVGRIEVDGTTTEFSASTTTFPWGLVIVPLVVLVEVVLIGGRNRLRRRIHPPPPPVPVEQLVVGQAPVVDVGPDSTVPAHASVPEPVPDVDDLVAAAVAGAFDERARTEPAPIDVAPIVSGAVARTAPSHSAGDLGSQASAATEDPATNERPRALVSAGSLGAVSSSDEDPGEGR